MGIEDLVPLIDRVGFPIVVCGVLFWYIKNTMNRNSDLMIEVQKSLAANTTTIALLVSKLEEK